MSKILLLGDFCIKESIEFSKNFLKKIESIDETIINLEGFVTDNFNENNLGINYRELEKVIKLLKIKAVSLANNHSNDSGELEKTIKKMNALGVKCFGIKGKERYENDNFSIYGSVWKLTGGNQKNLNSFNFEIGKLKNLYSEKVNIFYPHWGVELESLPHPWQINELKKIIKSNKIDLVCGHHTHLTSLNILIDKIPVFFSLGNFFIPNIELTNYYPKNSQIGMGVIYDLEKRNTEELLFKIEKNKVILLNDRVSKLEELKNFERYKKYFYINRTKKKLPVFTENNFINFLKGNYNLILIKLFKFQLIRKIWKRRREYYDIYRFSIFKK